VHDFVDESFIKAVFLHPRDEDAKCKLNRHNAPTVRRVDRIDEQHPSLLQIGDHHQQLGIGTERLVDGMAQQAGGLVFGRLSSP
jgi:hypothetical protein